MKKTEYIPFDQREDYDPSKVEVLPAGENESISPSKMGARSGDGVNSGLSPNEWRKQHAMLQQNKKRKKKSRRHRRGLRNQMRHMEALERRRECEEEEIELAMKLRRNL